MAGKSPAVASLSRFPKSSTWPRPFRANETVNPSRSCAGKEFPCPDTPFNNNSYQHHTSAIAPHTASNKPIPKPINQEPNDQHHPVATATPEMEELVSLQHAASLCDVNEITLRSWCKKRHIKWKRVKIGNKPRCLVRISDVRAYLTKRNPSTVGRVESSPAMPDQGEKAPASHAPTDAPQEPVGVIAHDSPSAAPAQIQACVGQVESKQNTAETNSTTLLLSEDATVPQSSVSLQPATSQPSASLKQKTRPPQVGSSGLLMHRAKKSMRKFGANDLCKISAWITQRLAKKFASKIAPSPSEQPTPAS